VCPQFEVSAGKSCVFVNFSLEKVRTVGSKWFQNIGWLNFNKVFIADLSICVWDLCPQKIGLLCPREGFVDTDLGYCVHSMCPHEFVCCVHMCPHEEHLDGRPDGETKFSFG